MPFPSDKYSTAIDLHSPLSRNVELGRFLSLVEPLYWNFVCFLPHTINPEPLLLWINKNGFLKSRSDYAIYEQISLFLKNKSHSLDNCLVLKNEDQILNLNSIFFRGLFSWFHGTAHVISISNLQVFPSKSAYELWRIDTNACSKFYKLEALYKDSWATDRSNPKINDLCS